MRARKISAAADIFSKNGTRECLSATLPDVSIHRPVHLVPSRQGGLWSAGLKLPIGSSQVLPLLCWSSLGHVLLAHSFLMGKAPEDHTASEGASVLPCHDINTKPMTTLAVSLKMCKTKGALDVLLVWCGRVGGQRPEWGTSGVRLELQTIPFVSRLLSVLRW